MKVRCIHVDKLTCFLAGVRKECHHFYPHEKNEQCDQGLCSLYKHSADDSYCIEIPDKEIENE
jgi:hypothetical protein